MPDHLSSHQTSGLATDSLSWSCRQGSPAFQTFSSDTSIHVHFTQGPSPHSHSLHSTYYLPPYLLPACLPTYRLCVLPCPAQPCHILSCPALSSLPCHCTHYLASYLHGACFTTRRYTQRQATACLALPVDHHGTREMHVFCA